jgi:hypothetical protein
MKVLLSTLTVFTLFFAACKQDFSQKKDAVAEATPYFQEIKKMEAQSDKVMPELVVYQKALKEILHSMEKANQTSDTTSMKVRFQLSELNKSEMTYANYKTTYNQRLDTMRESMRDAYLTQAKSEAETARDMVLYSVQQAKNYIHLLRDRGMQIPYIAEFEAKQANH